MTGLQFLPGFGCSPFGPCPGRDPRSSSPLQFPMMPPFFMNALPFYNYFSSLSNNMNPPVKTKPSRTGGDLGDGGKREAPEIEHEEEHPMHQMLPPSRFLPFPDQMKLAKPHQYPGGGYPGYPPRGGYYPPPGSMPFRPPSQAQDARNCLTNLGFTA